MIDNHPITPPPELVQEWRNQAPTARDAGATRELWIATQASQWGADQQMKLDAEQINEAWQKGADAELEACCEWLEERIGGIYDRELRADRRPKPPSLKEQALLLLGPAGKPGPDSKAWLALRPQEVDTIRRALEQLDD